MIRRGVPAKRIGGRLVTTVFDLLMAQYGGARATACRASGRPATTTPQPVHAGLAGGDHRRCPRRPRRGWRASSPATPSCPSGRSMIAMGAGTNHWFHSDQIYRTFFTLIDAVRLPGRERRRLGALRRAGEGAPADRVPDSRVRSRLAAADPAHDRHLVLLPAHRPVALRELRRRRARQPARPRPVPRAGRSPTACAQASRMGWTPSHPTFDRNPLDLADQAAAPAKPVDRLRRRRTAGRPAALRRRGPGRPGATSRG